MKSRLIWRVRFLSGCFALFAVLLITRLYFIQIVYGAAYSKEGMGQYVEPGLENRGDIYFTTKDGLLVDAELMQTGWRIAIDPQKLTDPAQAYAQMNAIVPID